jgi:aryl-alcohol dehydrogenase-like predicted oxidoreductase
VTAYGVLSRGLLTGSRPVGPTDYRTYLPRFQGEAVKVNDGIVVRLHALAAEKGVTASQLAIAWALAKGERIVPVVGARTRAQLEESLGALSVSLSPEEVARLEEAVPAAAVVGSRYPAPQMGHLDSER